METILEQLKSDFDGWGSAHDVNGFVNRVQSELLSKGFTSEGTRIVLSVCPDDINRLHERRTIEGGLTDIFNGEFHLGTLAAYPISGVTGLTAASHHAPDRHVGGTCVEGDLLFFASPHVGVMPGEKLSYGKIMRPGQEHLSASCGAMMGFLKTLREKKSCKNLDINMDDPLDMARQVIFCELVKHYSSELDEIIKINDENKQVLELAKINNGLVEDTIKRMLKAFLAKDHCDNRIILVTGITINAPGEDYFILREISVMKG